MKSLLSLIPFCKKYKYRFMWGILFVLLANAFGVAVPRLVGEAVNLIDGDFSVVDALPDFVLFILAIACLAGAFRYLMRRVLIDTSRDIEFDFRNAIYRKLQSLDSTFYDQHSTGDIMARMTNDVDQIRLVLGPAIMYTANTIFTLPLVMAMMLYLDWTVTLVGLIPMVLMPMLVKKFGARLHQTSKVQQDRMSDLTTYVQESLAGIRVIKAYGREDGYADSFSDENKNYIDASLDYAKVQTSFFPAIRFVAGLGFLGIIIVGAHRIVSNSMQYGDLVSMVMYFGMLIFPLIAIGWVVNIFQRAAASMDRLNEVFDAESKVKDPENVEDFIVPDNLDIEFKNLTFSYEGSSYPALENISLKIPEGQRIGVIGRVGSGKTTLIHLLLRLYPVERGQLFIGGVDINDWPVKELRRQLGIVFQETFLFSDSIRENIQFGALDKEYRKQVEIFAKMADVHEDIAEFPKQYETMLGERGINLSGGQKQRVSLARTISRNSRILILDDSLSAVDTHTEESILSELQKVMENRTTFLISHRISTVALTNQIIVLEEGKITQSGVHEDLVTAQGLYKELYELQQLEEEVQTA